MAIDVKLLNFIKAKFIPFQLIYLGWLIVIISLLTFVFSADAKGFTAFAPLSPGTGISADYFIQKYLSTVSPTLYLYLFGVLLPGTAFFLSYKILRFFLNANLSTLLALLLFSSIDGYPFHNFVLDVFQGNIKTPNTQLIRGVDFSTVLALTSLSIILNAKFLYIRQNFLAVFFIVLTISFDSLDGLSVSIVFALLMLLKSNNDKSTLATNLSAILVLSLAWIVNFSVIESPNLQVSDLPNLKSYLILYIISPAILFLIAANLFHVDRYQIFRRFSGIILVFFSECAILISHYLGAFEVLLTELQFFSIFPFFHVLYFVPTLFWIANSSHAKIPFLESDMIMLMLYNRYIKLFSVIIITSFLLSYNLLIIK